MGHTEEPRPAARFAQWEARLVLRKPALWNTTSREQVRGQRRQGTRGKERREEEFYRGGERSERGGVLQPG